ncbi:hypothetical protein K0M31_005547 [Melipona bicolor]|uniref:Uncharacterized protein n=1 Tax=Melipona bicolor TaxID=60889 RepID=A0AA40KMU1_9HYME|nr:hypothetical protein K0M31_005547 [Melipona bicolor]
MLARAGGLVIRSGMVGLEFGSRDKESCETLRDRPNITQSHKGTKRKSSEPPPSIQPRSTKFQKDEIEVDSFNGPCYNHLDVAATTQHTELSANLPPPTTRPSRSDAIPSFPPIPRVAIKPSTERENHRYREPNRKSATLSIRKTSNLKAATLKSRPIRSQDVMPSGMVKKIISIGALILVTSQTEESYIRRDRTHVKPVRSRNLFPALALDFRPRLRFPGGRNTYELMQIPRWK